MRNSGRWLTLGSRRYVKVHIANRTPWVLPQNPPQPETYPQRTTNTAQVPHPTHPHSLRPIPLSSPSTPPPQQSKPHIHHSTHSPPQSPTPLTNLRKIAYSSTFYTSLREKGCLFFFLFDALFLKREKRQTIYCRL